MTVQKSQLKLDRQEADFHAALWSPSGSDESKVSVEPPTSKGQCIELRAEMDPWCPQIRCSAERSNSGAVKRSISPDTSPVRLSFVLPTLIVDAPRFDASEKQTHIDRSGCRTVAERFTWPTGCCPIFDPSSLGCQSIGRSRCMSTKSARLALKR